MILGRYHSSVDSATVYILMGQEMMLGVLDCSKCGVVI